MENQKSETKKFLSNLEIVPQHNYTYFTTEPYQIKKDIELEKSSIYETSKLGKYSIFKTQVANIENIDQFNYPVKLILIEILETCQDYDARVKSKSAIIKVTDRVVNAVHFNLTIDHKNRMVWVEPVLTYIEN